jgi:5-aminovalerate/4-aminobutyrate aminotransferase
MAPAGSKVRGLGPMVAVELPEQTGDEAGRIVATAREKGLMLLSCGMHGNVIRILVPFTIDDDELERGLDILESLIGS